MEIYRIYSWYEFSSMTWQGIDSDQKEDLRATLSRKTDRKTEEQTDTEVYCRNSFTLKNQCKGKLINLCIKILNVHGCSLVTARYVHVIISLLVLEPLGVGVAAVVSTRHINALVEVVLQLERK